MHTNTKKDRIKRDLQGDLMDSNHVTRRFFRLWLDGSYLGEDHYKSNVAQLKAFVDDLGICSGLDAAIDRWVIPQFVRFTAQDANCSYGYAQKVIVEHFKQMTRKNGWDKNLLALFTTELGKDAADLIEDYLNEVRDAHNKKVLGDDYSNHRCDELAALGVRKITFVPANKGAA